MKVLLIHVSTTMCRDGDLWFYDEGAASTVSCLRARGHRTAFRMLTHGDGRAELEAWVDSQREDRSLIVYLTSVHFSAYAHEVPDTFRCAQGLGASVGIPTAFAGVWATFNAAQLIEHPELDFVIRGETDEALPELCDALEHGTPTDAIRNVWSRKADPSHRPGVRPLVGNLDDLPFPARDLLPTEQHANERDGILTVVASRGCPMSCEFCTHLLLRELYEVPSARYMRTKSVDYMIREITAARAANPEIWGIFFHDDMFALDPSWRREFFTRYRQDVGLPYGCNLVIGQVRAEFVRQLAGSGCQHVQIGIESGSAYMRDEVLGKAESEDRIVEALRLLREARIRVKVFALIGAPEETRARLVESLKAFARYGSDMVQVQVWIAHEGSALFARDPRAAEVGLRQRGCRARDDRRAWRLRFYFHYFQRYIALYQLLAMETRARWRAAFVRALVTASVRIPFAPELLLTRDWDGRARWPKWFSGLRKLCLLALGSLGARLSRDIGPLEDRLAADYLKPAGIDTPALGWRGVARLDRRRDGARKGA